MFKRVWVLIIYCLMTLSTIWLGKRFLRKINNNFLISSLKPSHVLLILYVLSTRVLIKLLKRYCNNLDVKLAFSSFKIRNMFSVKDPVPVELRSNVVYNFTCASCSSCYVGETSRHLSTRIREHLLNRDRTSHIFQHIQRSEACRNSCSAECFEVIDHATTKLQVKIKAALHISREQPSLNKQLYNVNLTLSF